MLITIDFHFEKNQTQQTQVPGHGPWSRRRKSENSKKRGKPCELDRLILAHLRWSSYSRTARPLWVDRGVLHVGPTKRLTFNPGFSRAGARHVISTVLVLRADQQHYCGGLQLRFAETRGGEEKADSNCCKNRNLPNKQKPPRVDIHGKL